MARVRKENGYEVSDRGRIHQTVKDAYYAAHRPQAMCDWTIVGGSPKRPPTAAATTRPGTQLARRFIRDRMQH